MQEEYFCAEIKPSEWPANKEKMVGGRGTRERKRSGKEGKRKMKFNIFLKNKSFKILS